MEHKERTQSAEGLNTTPGRSGGQSAGPAQGGAHPEASSAASPGVLVRRLGTTEPSRQHWVPLRDSVSSVKWASSLQSLFSVKHEITNAEAICKCEALSWWLTVQKLIRPDLGQHLCLCSGSNHSHTRMEIGKRSRDVVFNVVLTLLGFELGSGFAVSFSWGSDWSRGQLGARDHSLILERAGASTLGFVGYMLSLLLLLLF